MGPHPPIKIDLVGSYLGDWEIFPVVSHTPKLHAVECKESHTDNTLPHGEVTHKQTHTRIQTHTHTHTHAYTHILAHTHTAPTRKHRTSTIKYITKCVSICVSINII